MGKCKPVKIEAKIIREGRKENKIEVGTTENLLANLFKGKKTMT
ncbi:MAG: hypothetical protein CM1200mP12_02160 [Gammaproteobacteria bacterium]|nr:MAG: hypothetical protein CM1200mP12_02160 [Gammaproteobacteria bacterium]